MGYNIILCDCKPAEIQDLRESIERFCQNEFEILSCVTNRCHTKMDENIRRYCNYFTFPFLLFLKRKDLDTVIGWQQFYAINYALYSRLFHTKRAKLVVVLNFTYKKKRGLVGYIYRKYIQFVVTSPYIDYLHVLSSRYAKECSKELGVPFEKFLVTSFGVPDIFSKISVLKKPCEYNYCLSIGRSNRDFDFLVRVWTQDVLKNHQLVIISDTWRSNVPLPDNIHHFNNIKGDASFP